MNVWLAIYQPLAFLASLIVWPFFFMHPRGRLRLSDRYGCWGQISDRVIWFHGASVGEINGILPLIAKTREQFPGRGILVTAMSPTGLTKVENIADYVRLLPFDSSIWIHHAIKGLTIDAFVFGETEIWPTLLKELQKREIPVVMVNARISDYTFSVYKLLKPILTLVLSKVHAVCALTQVDGDRLRVLGVPPQAVHVTGNAKYDTHPSVSSEEEATKIRRTMFDGEGPTIVLGSLRPREEDFWLEALLRVWKEGRQIFCVLAPRHQEKFDYFARALEARGVSFVRRTAGRPAVTSQGERVVLLDTLGELERSYSFAEGAFVGGTLCDVGGHTPFEAAAYGVSLGCGPHIKNIREVVKLLENANAITMLHSAEDVYRFVRGITERDENLKARGENAYHLWRQMQGATDKACASIFNTIK